MPLLLAAALRRDSLGGSKPTRTPTCWSEEKSGQPASGGAPTGLLIR